MSKPDFFAGAVPSAVRLRERFSYQAVVSGNPRTERVGHQPTGSLEVVVPYDGHKHLGRKALEKLQERMSTVAPGQRVEACFGHLQFKDYSHTDLEEQLGRNLKHDKLPLEIPVQGDGLVFPGSLTEDRQACHITHEYHPHWPETTPLRVNANVFDEDAIREALVDEADVEATVVEDVAKRVAQQAGFSRSLIFAFDLELALPGWVGRAKDEEPPMLRHMSLEWPVSTSHHLVRLQIPEADVEFSVTYNPEAGSIEWGGIPFLSGAKSEGTELFSYRTPTMLLLIDRPGELYERDQLGGRVEIEIPRAFSGLSLKYYNENKKISKAPVDVQSTLVTEVDLQLEDCFERKTLSPYQYLQFEDVILDEMRVANIVMLLEDLGFTPRTWELKAPRSGMKRYLVRGTRPEGPDELDLWMLVEGVLTQTQRERRISGGETYTTTLDTGSMLMHMRGQLRKDSARLVSVMNEVQSRMKHLFLHTLAPG